MRLSRGLALFAALLGLVSAGSASADAPKPWEMGFQAPATLVMDRINSFHNEILYIITAISVFVLGLLVYVIIRFNQRAHPAPSRTTHNSFVEVAWTVIPILILLSIVVPSFKLLYYEALIPKPDLTLKVTGHTWSWSYEYPDKGGLSVDANVVDDKSLKPGQLRLLTTDNWPRVPVGAVVRVQITSTDVIHSWSIPSFGIKTDAVPGRLNETWFKVERPGTYYGECSQLCGNGHGYMPIMVEAVSKPAFDNWLVQAKKAAQANVAPAAAQLAAAPAN
jgi:cytochrome c oxidase subunit II